MVAQEDATDEAAEVSAKDLLSAADTADAPAADDEAADDVAADDVAVAEGDEAEVALGDAEELSARADEAVERMTTALPPLTRSRLLTTPRLPFRQSPRRRVDDRPEPTTMEELLNEQSTEIRSLKHGDVVEGTVVRIDKDEILVDIGAKSEGVVSNRELYGRNAETQPR